MCCFKSGQDKLCESQIKRSSRRWPKVLHVREHGPVCELGPVEGAPSGLRLGYRVCRGHVLAEALALCRVDRIRRRMASKAPVPGRRKLTSACSSGQVTQLHARAAASSVSSLTRPDEWQKQLIDMAIGPSAHRKIRLHTLRIYQQVVSKNGGA